MEQYGKSAGKGPFGHPWLQRAYDPTAANVAPPPQQPQQPRPKALQTTTIKEHGLQALMIDNKGNTVPMVWLCHSCHYPHYHQRPTCVNCKLTRCKEQEPTNFVRSRVK